MSAIFPPKSFEFEAACPTCKNPVTCLEAQRHSVVSCPHCGENFMVPDAAGRPDGYDLRCSRCGSREVSRPAQKLTGGGRVLMLIGVCLLPLYLTGLILMGIASCWKETKYQCFRCNKWF
jgi:predicted Zn finger-like uncharacterized protein